MPAKPASILNGTIGTEVTEAPVEAAVEAPAVEAPAVEAPAVEAPAVEAPVQVVQAAPAHPLGDVLEFVAVYGLLIHPWLRPEVRFDTDASHVVGVDGWILAQVDGGKLKAV